MNFHNKQSTIEGSKSISSSVFKSIWRHVCWTPLPRARGIHLDKYHRAGGTRERGLQGALARDIPFSPARATRPGIHPRRRWGRRSRDDRGECRSRGRSDDELVGEVLRACQTANGEIISIGDSDELCERNGLLSRPRCPTSSQS